jgi:hypothetical protein
MKPQKEGRNRRGQFLPGTSGNPAGRPTGRQSIATALRDLAGELAPARRGAPVGETVAERIARDLLERAAAGDLRAVSIVLERIDGKATADARAEEVVTIERIAPKREEEHADAWA